MQAQSETLQKVAEFVTILQPEGMTVRFLNASQDGTFNNLKSVQDICRVINEVTLGSGSRLGTVLDSKIIQPMIIQKARSDEFRKPVIVVVITDGSVSTNDSLTGFVSLSS